MNRFFKYIKKKVYHLLTDRTSIHRQFIVSFILISSYVALGKLAGFAKEMALAWRYGVGVTVDAYSFVFNLVNYPVSVWSGILTISYIPIAIGNKTFNKKDLVYFRKELLGISIVLACIVGGTLFYVFPSIITSKWLKLPLNLINTALELSHILSIILPLGILVSLYSTFMLSDGQHSMTLFESIPALILFLFIVLSPVNFTVKLLGIGSTMGFFVYLVVLIIYQKIRNTLVFPLFSMKSAFWPVFVKGFGPIVFAQALLSFTAIIDQIIASHIAPGSVATLNYANRVLMLISALGCSAINRGTLPLFSKMHLNKESSNEIFQTALIWFKNIMILSTLIIFAIGYLSNFIIKIIYERGAFDSSNTQAVTELFCYGLIQLLFLFGQALFASALYSIKRYKEMACIITLMAIIKISASLILNFLIGIKGIIIATGLMHFTGLVLCFFILKRVIKNNCLKN